MKELLFMLLTITLVLGACSNGDNESQNTDKSNQKDNQEKQDESIDVDESLLRVKITIPPSLLEGQDKKQVIAEAKEAGVSEVKENDDESLTYTMSKSTHKKMMNELKDSVNQTINEIKNNKDYTSIEDVKANDSFSEFTMVVDQQKFENSFDGFAALGLAMSGLYYQLFDGVDPDDYEVNVNMENAETGKVFDTVVYPDAFEEMEQE
ncbi:hypothetical protein [Virgibacillus doumboii]|uniref:hypothetical protein n=1 Tax=Virgibacillus doumboii TaxID=2697503 RepID=UPI0013DF46DB|nr:hypothetical protein [Virgibacillus doumboii]